MSDLDEVTEEIRDFLNEKLTPELRHCGEVFVGFDSPRSVAEEWIVSLMNGVGRYLPGRSSTVAQGGVSSSW